MRKIKAEKIEKESLTVKKFLLYLCITITLMWFGNIIGNIITMIIGNFMTHEIVNPIKHIIQNSNPYVNLIILSIIAPIFEEIFFRKLLIDRTIKYGATLSIILSASLFGLFHGNLSQFFYAFFLGGFFAYVYTKTGKVIYPIILHSTINLMGSVVSSIFAHALKNIPAFNPVDISIVAIYAIITISALIIGLYTILSDYNKIDLNEIYLEKPVKTVVLNVGMILFILFHILLILRSLNIIKLF
ncbi:MAG: CPBP family intramembrane metalloprotease [Methanobrevibacter sp.]|nr:CPBP family intramembrane metalloprotease [Methanobrevibacter sp.]